MKWSRTKITSIVALLITAVIAVVFLLPKLSPVNKRFDLPTEQAGLKAPQGRTLEDGSKIYSDTHYGFSFKYPETFSIGVFSDADNTKTILVQNTEKNIGIQVFISAFDEDIMLTADRIKKELPALVMTEIKDITIDGVKAVSFSSTNTGADESREVWFVRGEKLYQISLPTAQAGTPDNSRALLYNLLTTWKWNT